MAVTDDPTQADQLSLTILPHPEVAARQRRGDAVWLPGDRLLLTVADDDGEVIGQAYAEVKGVVLEPIEDKDLGHLGTRRVHRAKLVDG